MAKLLEVKGLRTQFFTQDGVVHAVNGISYDLNEGETLGIVGESGCGKTVSVLSVMRLIPQPPGKIVGGDVWFDGRNIMDLREDEVRQVRGNRIAMIFQDPMTSLNPVLTVGTQVGEALQLHMGMDRAQARRRTIELLQMVNIPEAADRVDDYPHQFSGGMRQRVMIAMALSCNPQLLIADEPTTALDVITSYKILKEIKRIQAEYKQAMMMISHDISRVAEMSDRMAVMYGGRIAETATTKDLFSDAQHPYTRGLIDSIPTILGEKADMMARLKGIPGSPPPLVNPPKGCRFHPRCEYAKDKCEKDPDGVEVGPDHIVWCFKAEAENKEHEW